MIIELSDSASKQQAAQLASSLADDHGPVRPVTIKGRQLLVCPQVPDSVTALGMRPEIGRMISSPGPFHLASRSLFPAGSVIEVNSVPIGGPSFTVIAGPCAVESKAQLAASAQAVDASGAALLRGGAYKPRTSPYSFQGLGGEGLRLLAEQRRECGLGVVTEATQPAEVAAVAEWADMVQIGARNMQNFALLKEAGKAGVPVLLKRAMSGTVDEWLCAAEYMMSEGNSEVVLCERGIRAFGTETRFTLDLSIVALVKRLSHLPVIVDPSHSTGDPALVAPMTLAAAAAGADGVIIDVHADPVSALCDGKQALAPQEFKALMDDLERVTAAVGRGPSSPERCGT